MNNCSQADPYFEIVSSSYTKVYSVKYDSGSVPEESILSPRGTSPENPEPNSLYRGTSLIRNTPLLGPYSRTKPRVLWWSWGGGLFIMSEVPLCTPNLKAFDRRGRVRWAQRLRYASSHPAP